jgi:DNA-directed RNA polymerase subunit K/omega
MRVFTPDEVAVQSRTNKYLGVLVAAKYTRGLNEFPRDRAASKEKKLTTRALEELTNGALAFRVVPRRRVD